jgi:hypothetical protein
VEHPEAPSPVGLGRGPFHVKPALHLCRHEAADRSARVS